MSNISDINPHAFPVPEYTETVQNDFRKGMSLLDYFAGQAIIGLLSNSLYSGFSETQLSDKAYDIAANMLGTRKWLMK